MEVLDPGHQYKLATLDGDVDVVLTFVKREGEKYPGNVGHYPGTTLQEVLRASLNRVRYVNAQHPAEENDDVEYYLITAVQKLEERAARLHGRTERIGEHRAEFGPFCTVCGHVGHQCAE